MKIENKSIVNENDMYFLFSKNSLLKEIFENYGSPPNWEREPGFETLIKIILEQQVSLSSAKAHFLKLKENLGEVTVDNILNASDEQLTNSHLSRQKKVYTKALAEEIRSGAINLDELQYLSEKEVRAKLTAVKGIGNWTADVYLMMCLKKADIFPIGDVALKNTIK